MEKDHLTGLYNKQYFEQYVTEKIGGGQAQEAYMLMIDLDNFKDINDEKGHSVADEVLKRAAIVLEHTLKVAEEESIAARFGGYEFMIWLKAPKDIDGTVQQILEKFNDTMECNTLGLFVGASIGGSYWKEGQTYQELFEEADKAMYLAKRQGKNHYKNFH